MSIPSLYQQASTTILSAISEQCPISTLAAFNPSIYEWDIAGSAEVFPGRLYYDYIWWRYHCFFHVFAAQDDKASGGNNRVYQYPSHSVSLFADTLSLIHNESQSLSFSYQEGSQVYYYNQGTVGPLHSEEFDPCVWPYGSILSYTGVSSSASQT